MHSQSLNDAFCTAQTSWSGTHGAKPAVVLSQRDSNDQRPPVSATSMVAAAKVAGTVVVLSQDANFLAQVRQNLAAQNVRLQHYPTTAMILATAVPAGPACLVVDLDGKEAGGRELLEQIRAKGWRLPVVALIRHAEIRTVVQFMRAGVEDVLLKTGEPAELQAAVRAALNQSQKCLRQRWRDPDLQRRLDQLTSREMEVVNLVLAGMLNKEIAEKLHLALVTVKVHRGSAMRKLGARSAAELARLALMNSGSNLLDRTDRRLDEPLTSFDPLAAVDAVDAVPGSGFSTS